MDRQRPAPPRHHPARPALPGMSMTCPELTAERDRPTIVALHLFSQVLGKVPTALLPWRNHGWHLTLHMGPRGIATEPVHAEAGTFVLAFHPIDHLFAL